VVASLRAYRRDDRAKRDPSGRRLSACRSPHGVHRRMWNGSSSGGDRAHDFVEGVAGFDNAEPPLRARGRLRVIRGICRVAAPWRLRPIRPAADAA